MITEDYCSKEVLELLKAKGFVEFDGCVTHQAAMKWLRDVHSIFISIGNDFREYNWILVNLRDRNEDGDPTAISGLHSCFCRYEEAVDDALKEAMARI